MKFKLINESILEAASKVKITGGSCSTKWIYDTMQDGLNIKFSINGHACDFIFRANHGRYIVDGIDCDAAYINDERVEPITTSGGTARSYAISVPGSIMTSEPKENQKDFGFTGQYYKTTPIVKYIKEKLTDLLNNSIDIFSDRFLDKVGLSSDESEQIKEEEERRYSIYQNYEPVKRDASQADVKRFLQSLSDSELSSIRVTKKNLQRDYRTTEDEVTKLYIQDEKRRRGLKEDIDDPQEVLIFKREVSMADNLDDIQDAIYNLSDGVAEDLVQQAFDANEMKNLQAVKDAVIVAIDNYLEDGDWLGESINESKSSIKENDLNKWNTLLAAYGQELRELKKVNEDGSKDAEIKDILNKIKDAKLHISELTESKSSIKTFGAKAKKLTEDSWPKLLPIEEIPDNRKWQYSVGGVDVPYTSYEDAMAHLKDDYKIEDYREELQKFIDKETGRPHTFFVDATFDGRLCIDISWGDWKHEHGYADYLVREFFNNKGLGIDIEVDTTAHDGGDAYSAIHYYDIDDLFFSGRVVEESLREGLNDYRFYVSCNDGPEKLIRTVAENEDKAIKYVKDMYAKEHSTYADDRANKWNIKNLDEALSENSTDMPYMFFYTAVNSTFGYDFEEFAKSLGAKKVYGRYKGTAPGSYFYLVPSEEVYNELKKVAKKEYGVDMQRLKAFNSEEYPSLKTINEAHYGGAYDVADEAYFTKEDLVTFAEDVIDALDKQYDLKFDINELELYKGVLYLGLISENGIEMFHEQRIDMRKIKVPKDLNRYLDEFISAFRFQIDDNADFLYEGLWDDIKSVGKSIKNAVKDTDTYKKVANSEVVKTAKDQINGTRLDVSLNKLYKLNDSNYEQNLGKAYKLIKNANISPAEQKSQFYRLKLHAVKYRMSIEDVQDAAKRIKESANNICESLLNEKSKYIWTTKEENPIWGNASRARVNSDIADKAKLDVEKKAEKEAKKEAEKQAQAEADKSKDGSGATGSRTGNGSGKKPSKKSNIKSTSDKMNGGSSDSSSDSSSEPEFYELTDKKTAMKDAEYFLKIATTKTSADNAIGIAKNAMKKGLIHRRSDIKRLNKLIDDKARFYKLNVNEDFDYENDDWSDDGEVASGKSFIEAGTEYVWEEKIGSTVNMDFDSWAVWSARDIDNDILEYFIVEEDTGFIDWGPVDTAGEAREFLQSKLDDYSEEDSDEDPLDFIDYNESLTEDTGASAKTAISSMLKDMDDSEKASTVSKILDIIPDEYADKLFSATEKTLNDKQIPESDKQNIINQAEPMVDDKEKLDSVDSIGDLLNLIDLKYWAKKDPKMCKNLIVTILAIIAVIEPTPVVEIITVIVKLLPANVIAKIIKIFPGLSDTVGKLGSVMGESVDKVSYVEIVPEKRGFSHERHVFDTVDEMKAHVKQQGLTPSDIDSVVGLNSVEELFESDAK